MRRHLISAASALALAFCVWHAMQLFAPPAPFAQPYTKATAAQNAEITRQIAITVIAGPIALILTLLASWPMLTVTRARTCLVIGVVMLCTGIFGTALGWSLPYGFGSSYMHASDAQRLHMAIGMRSGAVFFAAGIVFVAISAVLKRRSSAPRPQSVAGGSPTEPSS